MTVAHEELLRSWTRLRDWLQPSIADQALHRALVDDVQAWHDHDQDPSYLYRGSQLLAVRHATRRWAADPAGRLSVDRTAADFLAAGHRRARRRQRAYRAVAAVMVVLLLATGGAAIVAVTNAARANRQHAMALSRQLAAQSRAIRARDVITSADRATSERLAAAALHVAHTDEAAAAASALLGDGRNTLLHTRPVGGDGVLTGRADPRHRRRHDGPTLGSVHRQAHRHPADRPRQDGDGGGVRPGRPAARHRR
nr:hypothetical protein GCM10020092_062720 [Actinoplanes digitatis]